MTVISLSPAGSFLRSLVGTRILRRRSQQRLYLRNWASSDGVMDPHLSWAKTHEFRMLAHGWQRSHNTIVKWSASSISQPLGSHQRQV